VFIALSRAGVKIVVVTHLFDLAESLYEKGVEGTLFMRAPRQAVPRPSSSWKGHQSRLLTARIVQAGLRESATAIAPASPP